MNRLSRFRQAGPRLVPSQLLPRILAMLLAGAAMGVLAKWLDFSSELLGNLLSELPVWILLGLLIARFSGRPGRAAVYAFAFFLSMVAFYYLTADRMGGVYGIAFVYGWTAAACLSPLAAFAAWYAFGRGWVANLLSAGAIAAAALSDVLVFRRAGVRDVVLTLLCAVLLCAGKRKRND